MASAITYEYPARIEYVVDGDTMDVVVELGFNMQRKIRVRLSEVDTHETYGVSHDSEEYQRGARETHFVKDWVKSAMSDGTEWPFIVKTEKTGKYGRYLAIVMRQDTEEMLHEALLDSFDDLSR
jgi:micrococcal nuclease